ncbi:9489_t:CDS:2, partial [Racocetra fulgida]
LSQSEVSTSDERNNMVDEISVECDNSVNNNDIFDEHNNLINEYENSLVNEYEYNLVDEYDDNLPTKNMSKTPNLKEINWIWSYYQRYEAVPPYKTIVSCLVEVHKNNKSELCGHLMGSVDSSMRNYIGHLATRHGITESSHNKKIKQPLSSQLQIDKMIYGNPERKRRLDQKFVELLIKD